MKRWIRISICAAAACLSLSAAGSAFAQPALTRVHLRGVNDAFAAPTDPVTQGIGCTSRYSGVTWRPFDDPSPNKSFCETLRNLPKNIVCPGANTLKIHMRAHGDIPTNDTLALFFGAGAARWSQSIATITGMAWNPGDEATVTLDLCNLPAGAAGSVTNAATEIDLSSMLDVFAQDDTEIDYLELTLTALSIELVYGAMDAYALPADPTFRSPDHTAARPAATRDFDDTSINDAFGETLGNPPNTAFGDPPDNLLPLYVIGGEIEIAMKAAGELSCNDTLGLNLYTGSGASPIGWARSIGDPTKCGRPALVNLAGLGSPAIPSLWSGGSADTTLILDLDGLPPGANNGVTSVIPMMSGPRRLDVTLQDDTNVDYIKLRVLCSRNKPDFTVRRRIPTISEWGMLLLVALLMSAGVALIQIRRVRRMDGEPRMG